MIDISISNLSKEFEVGKKIRDGLTFQVDQGERVGLLGKNGAGKTTLFKVLTGELDWDEGEVHVAPGKGVGLISQIPVYPPAYTVEDVLQTAFDRLHAMEAEMARLAEQMGADTDPALLRRYDALTAAFEAGGGYDTQTELNKVCNGLEISQDMRGQLFSSLSGGEKARANLARLIPAGADLLLLDETTESTAGGDRIAQAIRYMNRHLFEPIGVQDAAAAVSLSPSHFSRQFKARTGYSPYEYIVLRRIDKAKYMLASTELSVKEIAYATGYNSEENFIHSFRKNVGVAPGIFRKYPV